MAMRHWPSFVDPAVSSTYDPGSVMKAMTMAMGIDSGVITPDSTYDDTGSATVDGITLHNWDESAHGNINMTQVLQYSANTGAIWAAQHIGSDRFTSYLNDFGFLQPTGLGLPDEAAGSRDQSSAADLTMSENAFGESIAVTPLQMVMAYGALANGGLLMRPYIVSSVAASNGQGPVTRYEPQTVRQVVSPATAETVTQMLVQSAALSEAQMNLVQGYTVAAKTGTSTPGYQQSLRYIRLSDRLRASDPSTFRHTGETGPSARNHLWRLGSGPTLARPGRATVRLLSDSVG